MRLIERRITESRVRAGGINLQHNETLLRGQADRPAALGALTAGVIR